MEKYQGYIDIAISYGIKIVGAILIFIIGKWITKLLTNLFRKALQKSNTDETLIKFLGDLIYFALLVLVIIAALGTLGVNTTSFAAIIGAAGLAVGLALQANFSNFGAGIVILFLRPFKVGDFVEAGGATGVVESIGIFNTTIKTGDNRVIIVPNSNIIGGNIVNYSKEPIRRIDLVIGVGYEDDLKLVKHTLEEILKSDERILKDPAPSVALAELADSSVNFNVRPWVKSGDYWAVRSDLLEKIKVIFDEKGINIPYPQMDVHIDQKAA
ncbi:mechanosensitive ion channel [Caminibacter mediatlanticus TB-2]|uniref:Mechanosensitive ion channel n=1 Tax=Caminibacter mediatlanticus TB-2 TaxID=391592 RepID=A0ABX5V736_9BACT|nr:mechanosensitive ion channel domain-containing protein [Caminibacter mediatlanticus]QCT93799.1 mechanosensitive ion channel [Caminibacter mediatlanticus TB-2]